jgi:hypothetical protein
LIFRIFVSIRARVRFVALFPFDNNGDARVASLSGAKRDEIAIKATSPQCKNNKK